MKTNLEDIDLNCLLVDVVSYKNLWGDVLEKRLATVNENEEVVDTKTNELKKYLEDKGVKFSKKIDTKSCDLNYNHFAEFEC